MNIDIEKLGRQALSRIKEEWGLPKRGLLAGGSLANIIWELVSGNKAIVNDIDIFLLEQETDYEEVKSLFEYKETEDLYYEQYAGIGWVTKTKDYYKIKSAEKEGIFNNIGCVSNSKDPFIVINSFDINSTRVGYDIEQDKFYWTSDFEEFLKTGELKISTLITPAHTAIRISKKQKELNATLNEFEYKLCQHSLHYKFSDILRYRFKDRYKEMYVDNFEILKKYFKIRVDDIISDYVKNKYQSSDKIYELVPLLDSKVEEGNFFIVNTKSVFNDVNLNKIHNSKDFLFYMRNIYGDIEKSKVFSDLSHLFRTDDYIDTQINDDDVQLLSRLSKWAPASINNLKGYKLSEQIFIVKKLLKTYKEDPIIAISILEDIKIDKDIDIDEQTSLLLELSVRKKIVNDTKGKVKKILYGDDENNQSYIDLDIF